MVTVAGEEVVLDETKIDLTRPQNFGRISFKDKYMRGEDQAEIDTVANLFRIHFNKKRGSKGIDPALGPDMTFGGDDACRMHLKNAIANRIESIADEILTGRALREGMISTDIAKKMDTLEILKAIETRIDVGEGAAMPIGGPRSLSEQEIHDKNLLMRFAALFLQRRGADQVGEWEDKVDQVYSILEQGRWNNTQVERSVGTWSDKQHPYLLSVVEAIKGVGPAAGDRMYDIFINTLDGSLPQEYKDGDEGFRKLLESLNAQSMTAIAKLQHIVSWLVGKLRGAKEAFDNLNAERGACANELEEAQRKLAAALAAADAAAGAKNDADDAASTAASEAESQAERAAAAAAAATGAAAEQDIKGLRDQIAALQARLSGLEGARDAAADLQGRLAQAQQDAARSAGIIDGANVTIDELRARITALEGRVTEAEANRKAALDQQAKLGLDLVNAMQGRAGANQAAIDSLRGEIANATARAAASDAELRTLRGELDAARGGLSEAQAAAAAAGRERDAAAAARDAAAAARDAAVTAAQTAAAEAERLRSEASAAAAAAAKTVAELQTQLAAATEQATSAGASEAARAAAAAEAQRLRGQLAAAQAAEAAAARRQEELEAAATAARAAQEKAQQEAAAARTVAERETEAAAAARREQERLSEQLAKLNSQLEKLREELRGAEARAAAAGTAGSDAAARSQAEINRLQAEISRITTERGRIETFIIEMRDNPQGPRAVPTGIDTGMSAALSALIARMSELQTGAAATTDQNICFLVYFVSYFVRAFILKNAPREDFPIRKSVYETLQPFVTSTLLNADRMREAGNLTIEDILQSLHFILERVEETEGDPDNIRQVIIEGANPGTIGKVVEHIISKTTERFQPGGDPESLGRKFHSHVRKIVQPSLKDIGMNTPTVYIQTYLPDQSVAGVQEARVPFFILQGRGDVTFGSVREKVEQRYAKDLNNHIRLRFYPPPLRSGSEAPVPLFLTYEYAMLLFILISVEYLKERVGGMPCAIPGYVSNIQGTLNSGGLAFQPGGAPAIGPGGPGEAAAAEAERQRQAAASAEAERQRQAAAATEAERQRQAAAATEAERQRQAAAAKAVAEAAATEAERQRQAAAKAAAAAEAKRQRQAAAEEAERQRQAAAEEAERQRQAAAAKAAEEAAAKAVAEAAAKAARAPTPPARPPVPRQVPSLETHQKTFFGILRQIKQGTGAKIKEVIAKDFKGYTELGAELTEPEIKKRQNEFPIALFIQKSGGSQRFFNFPEQYPSSENQRIAKQIDISSLDKFGSEVNLQKTKLKRMIDFVYKMYLGQTKPEKVTDTNKIQIANDKVYKFLLDFCKAYYEQYIIHDTAKNPITDPEQKFNAVYALFEEYFLSNVLLDNDKDTSLGYNLGINKDIMHTYVFDKEGKYPPQITMPRPAVKPAYRPTKAQQNETSRRLSRTTQGGGRRRNTSSKRRTRRRRKSQNRIAATE
jgi:hypothetical protein